MIFSAFVIPECIVANPVLLQQKIAYPVSSYFHCWASHFFRAPDFKLQICPDVRISIKASSAPQPFCFVIWNFLSHWGKKNPCTICCNLLHLYLSLQSRSSISLRIILDRDTPIHFCVVSSPSAWESSHLQLWNCAIVYNSKIEFSFDV
jgi:hypothetical protein